MSAKALSLFHSRCYYELMSSVDSVKKSKSANCPFSGINPLFVISVKNIPPNKTNYQKFLKLLKLPLMKSADTQEDVITAVDTVELVL